ncbi:MAG: PolC-type DNA polymerase III [Hespellia sp.]|nr:PolC-type DNA polymerase III [Hespellia sp.]
MAQKFFETFPTLRVEDDIQVLFNEVEVTKVATTSLRDKINIHIFSRHLIEKAHIYQMEQSIKEQLFGRAAVTIHIKEKYQLSEQYTSENLMEIYAESIALELKNYSVLAAQMFERAKFTFESGNILCLEMADNIVAEGKQNYIVDLLKEVYNERFSIPTEIRIIFKKAAKKSRANEQDELLIQKEINSIFKRRAELAKENGEGGDDKKEDSKKKEKTKKPFVKNDYVRMAKLSDDPNLIYGRNFDDEPIMLNQVVGEMGEITFQGKVFQMDQREIKNEKTILIFSVTDFTDSITVKMFVKNEQLADILGDVTKGCFLKIKGVTTIDKFDGELTIGSISGMKKIADFTSSRSDNSLQKRVELHCHTKMSDMDGVSECKNLVKRAHDWGHKAIAITDHGIVQAFPDANHMIEDFDKADKDREEPFKVIYGVEAYLVDDLTDIAVGAGNQTLDDTYVVFDLETTGFSAIKDKIIEIGAVKVKNGEIIDKFSEFVNPRRPIPFHITQLTSITDEMVMEAEDIETLLPQFLEFVGDAVLVAHNASFDVGFIEQNCRYQDIVPDFISVDTVALARVLLPTISKYKLNNVAKALNISLENHHRAVDDAGATAEIFVKFIEMLKERGITTLKGVNQFGDMNPDAIRKMPSYHAIILIEKLNPGKENLYRLISDSNLIYYGRRPRIPKSEYNKYREGLIIGSACEAGELYQAILNKKNKEFIARLCEFYDYYEIQPLGNNRFMIESDKYSDIRSDEDLIQINKEIVQLGEQFKKPVVATCDVHFMDPEDEVYRRIIMAGKGFTDADKQAPLYLRTTEEMLAEFEYLGPNKAKEVVIDNTNLIADRIEKISPINPDKCPPVIPNSEQDLTDICYTKAHSLYGENLPEVVEERLQRELKSIIGNGYAVMYIIAQKLVWKSNEDGYLVGSRGSVGSSFVATMSGITEVNPLAPHYYCKECHYSDFESEEVKSYAGTCGYDMPDKNCPVCGSPLIKDGFDIPFETFLGFKGDKEPDIDLNFSGDYQSKAHKYTEVIFGEGHTFKAGTIGTLADKTAYGYVKNYYEERGHRKRKCEIERIVEGCTGIRRSTGQHPGGIVVLPHGHNINEFTPIQHPANDMTSDIITTHFDYHSIDHNLLKLDILGHDDPTIIRALEDYITSDAMENEYNENNPFIATKIPLDDPGVMSLFHDTSALGIKPEDIDGCKLGCLGVPEFGTSFVIQMVQDAKPKTLSDLIRISGLSHGTNVWLGNAEVLIKEGKATISTAICTRDDIMAYLIGKNMDSALSFSIMEKVRKGKGLTPEWEEEMKAHDVPQWYIDSCNKISYMFPKAHAAAYVMMAYRIAYCKINYPLAYYAAYFGIRANAFSYEIMCQGKEKLNFFYQDYKKRSDSLSNKEQDTLKDMKIVQEMYARGFEFLPLDIYTSKATKFQIVDGKLLPPFSSVEGMGEKAAELVELAQRDGKYLSLDDFRQRTKCSQTVIDLMNDMGLFGNLPKSNQLSLFDL